MLHVVKFDLFGKISRQDGDLGQVLSGWFDIDRGIREQVNAFFHDHDINADHQARAGAGVVDLQSRADDIRVIGGQPGDNVSASPILTINGPMMFGCARV